ncbi:MAG: hypothetical protein H6R12_2445, partial [Proteobacteria bacterium]|nr:hypothetical protein [Pseudomonadota bacterium]
FTTAPLRQFQVLVRRMIRAGADFPARARPLAASWTGGHGPPYELNSPVPGERAGAPHDVG